MSKKHVWSDKLWRIALCLVSLAAVGGLVSSLNADTDNRPIIVLRVDDCYLSWRTPFPELGGISSLNYCKTKRIPITWAIVTSRTASGANLTYSELKDYLDTCGGEPASHSVNHTGLPDAQAYIDELAASKAQIEANLPGYSCRTFIEPGNWFDPVFHIDRFSQLDNNIGQALQAQYNQSMEYLGRGWTIGNMYYSHGLSCSQWLDTDPQSPPATLQDEMKLLDIVAATPGLIWVIGAHGPAPAGDTTPYYVPVDYLKAVVDKIANLRDRGRVRLMSLNDAYHCSFSTDLNHIANPGFEFDLNCPNPGTAPGRWTWTTMGACTIASSGGVGNSRYAQVVRPAGDTNTTLWTHSSTVLAPGRYELSWWQKSEPGYPTNNPSYVLRVVLSESAYGVWRKPIDNASVTNTQTNTWERKSALFIVDDRTPFVDLQFKPAAGSGYGIDDVAIVSVPLNPSISPYNTIITPSPGHCKVGWMTPDDPAVTTIVIRYGNSTHPLKPTEGLPFASLPAIIGTHQEITAEMNWPMHLGVYFSVFAVKGDGQYSAPDIQHVWVDPSLPPTPAVTLSLAGSHVVQAEWSAAAAGIDNYQYIYAVGTSPGGSNVRNWTTTQATQVAITGLPSGHLYVTVRTLSKFGYTSQAGFADIVVPDISRISLAASTQNETPVTVTGSVSAVFSDCIYVEQEDRSRGIKCVGGGVNYQLNQKMMIDGIIRTNSDGERYIQVASAMPLGEPPFVIKPLAMNNRTLGGSNWRYDPISGAGSKGITNGRELNNIGLLVVSWGKVTARDSVSGVFTIYQGASESYSGMPILDSDGNPGVRVSAPGLVLPPLNAFVTVTGISSCYKSGPTDTFPVVRPRSQNDIVIVNNP